MIEEAKIIAEALKDIGGTILSGMIISAIIRGFMND